MIGRKCPNCNTKWYSANTGEWICGKCRKVLTDKDNIETRVKDGYREKFNKQDNRK